jgi:hypothetical protein
VRCAGSSVFAAALRRRQDKRLLWRIALVLCFGIGGAYAAEPGWIADPETGCKIAPFDEPECDNDLEWRLSKCQAPSIGKLSPYFLDTPTAEERKSCTESIKNYP